jgi:hypothetical protein|tara:strand:+ start:614 stop:1072 length:459 start_codon:yes stop_codon:yes gene_type:complete
MTKRLTAKQEAFARLVALENLSLTDAYGRIYNTTRSAPATINKEAYNLGSKNPKIAARIQELREKVFEQPLIATKSERMELLTKVMRDDAQRSRDKLHAIEILGKIEGDFVTASVTETNINLSLKQYSSDDLLAMLQAAKRQGEIVEGERVD